ncbi:MAG: tellurium resistance protein TerD [Clostridiales bacterium]|nr:tellurium resistance protein TerD [Clostridiales bacterium]
MGVKFMVNVPMNLSAPLTKQTIASINQINVQGAKTSQTILSLNRGRKSTATPPNSAMPSSTCSRKIPSLLHNTKKGQKIPLFSSGQLARIKCCLGWNCAETCDIDVSAFLLNFAGKVLGDSWFVFYGQTLSPDGSVRFNSNESIDRESISIDLTKINSSVAKIVFVLTIHEAIEKNLNFSMVKDAYIRILNRSNNEELVSFKMDEYYSNVTSMMIGEIYLHNNAWKFNAIGNGVTKDLAGLCELYGVHVV